MSVNFSCVSLLAATCHLKTSKVGYVFNYVTFSTIVISNRMILLVSPLFNAYQDEPMTTKPFN